MGDPSVTLHPAHGDALAYVTRLLADEGLPTTDVPDKRDCLFVATVDGERIGVGGVERHGSVGLLRSLAVEPGSRGQGYGSAICAALEERAREDGIRRLYVLTTRAVAFFTNRGYREIPRQEAPRAIRETDEFADLCPGSATCLVRTLEADRPRDGS